MTRPTRWTCRACGGGAPCYLEDPHGSAYPPVRCPWNGYLWEAEWVAEVPA